MQIKDLSNLTFIIPLKVEHSDRYRNARTVLGFINEHMMTNIFIYEVCENGVSKLDFIEDLKNLNIKHWKEKDEGTFHRTKYLNIMLDEVETPVVANYDIDVVIPYEFYKLSVDAIISGESDVIYPYKFGWGGQRRVLENFDYDAFAKNGFDTNYIDVTGPFSDYDSEYGHCIFFNTDIYKKHGAENEYFISYGPEDKERGERFKKMGFKVNWISNCIIYHFEHYRGADSSNANSHFAENWVVFNLLKDMDGNSLKEYYQNCEYNSKYKTIGK